MRKGLIVRPHNFKFKTMAKTASPKKAATKGPAAASQSTGKTTTTEAPKTEAKAPVPVVTKSGNQDLFVTLAESTSSSSNGEYGRLEEKKTTEAMETGGGCVLLVTTTMNGLSIPAMCFVPGVSIRTGDDGKSFLD